MTDKCIVKGCTNHKDEGEFVGDLCLPCYLMLTDARTGPSDAWFVTVIKELQREKSKLNAKLESIRRLVNEQFNE